MTIDEIIEIAALAGKDKPLGVEHLDKLFGEVDTAIYYRFIYHLILSMKPSLVVELGTLFGRCAAHMAAARIETLVLAIDCDPKPEALMVSDRYKNIRLIHGSSIDQNTLALVDDKSVDLLLIDTTHDFDQVSMELHCWTRKMKSGGVILFDDISENQSMIRAWDAIKEMFPQSASLPMLHHSGFGAVIV